MIRVPVGAERSIRSAAEGKVGSRKSEVRACPPSVWRGRKSEVRGQRSEVGCQRSEQGLMIVD